MNIEAVGICAKCGIVSMRETAYQSRLLKHASYKRGIENWGCPHCNDPHYFLMPIPKYTPAMEYLSALAEALATWPNGKFKKTKVNVEKGFRQKGPVIGQW